MSSRKSAVPLELDPRPSRRLGVFALVVYGGALAVMAALALPWWGVVAVTGAVLVEFARFFREHVLRSGRRAILKLIWDEDGRWTLFTARAAFEAVLLPASVVYPELVILRFRFVPRAADGIPRRRATVLLPPDSLDRRSFRRLRMRLEMEATR